MKKIKILFFYFIITLGLGVFIRCNGISCDCPENVKPFISIDGIGALHRSEVSFFVDENAKLEASKHYMIMPVLSSFTTKSDDIELNYNNLFITNVSACSCAFDGELGLKTKADTILVKLMTNYDTQFKKGDCINQLIEIEDRGVFPFTRSSIKQIVEETNSGNFFASERFAFRFNHSTEFKQSMMNSFDGVPFQVEIELRLKDGTSKKGFSQNVYLTK
jgi:hypothetical protein